MQPTIYIPNLNGAARLARLLDSLERQTAAASVVVVDNGSGDDSVAMVRERFSATQVIALERNRGFGVALNLAIAERPGDPILLVNNDVQCDPAFVAEMLAAQRPGVEMVAGVLTQNDAPGLIDSAGVVAARDTLMAFDYLHGEPVSAAAEASPPLAPTGGAALYSLAAFEEVGGFDERIFAYYEDLDLGLRLRVAGAGCALASRATARHLYSATLRGRIGDKYALTGWSRGYMLRRYGVMTEPRNAARALLGELAICAGQVVLDRTAKGARGRVRGWRDGAGLERRPLPDLTMTELPLLPSLARRLRRHAGG
ncbi:MAG TPA: glycosyltransferase family 2 protein [Solirubrobacterales bacterium]|nr:glycosyltransferase family 2 protein [Solirubrobacterales bacterium]